MTRRADTVVIENSDPNCRGITSSDGQHEYAKDGKGRIEMPRHEARRVLGSGNRDTRSYRPIFALNSGMLEPVEFDPVQASARAALEAISRAKKERDAECPST